MNLKEAFRYQNHLDVLLSDAIVYLSNRRHNTCTVQEHRKSSVNAEAQDVTLDTDAIYMDRGEHYDVGLVMAFASELLSEKACVAFKIEQAKAENNSFMIDVELAINKNRQRLARVLADMCHIKPMTRTFKGRDYRFNTDGNHVEYYYDVLETVSLDFDKDEAKRRAKALASEAESVSALAEVFLLQTQVNHTPRFELSDTFEDAIANFKLPPMEETYVKHAV